jgi:hypothetical protein
MYRFPTSDLIRSVPLSATHPAGTLALLFALLVGLGCDENAPTETRAPMEPTELGPGQEEPSLAVGDITAMGTIPLPINQSIATTFPEPAFRINQTGTGQNAVFHITNTGSFQTPIQGLTSGKGRAGYFQINNATNSAAALEVLTNGTGRASLFKITTTNSVSPVVNAVHSGLGSAGRFEITNTNNGSNALEAFSNNAGRAFAAVQTGSGMGGFFQTVSTNTGGSPALWAEVNDQFRTAFNAYHSGGGMALQAQGTSRFSGDVTVVGTLTKTAGSFRIDHPLDPERKYLSHSFVESPDMMNVYNGNATLDENGRATVELPEYFEALNKDFRYQLTAVGAPGPNLYVAEGVKQNRFKIAGGRPYASVSWQVTGIRQDTYANEHRVKVEEDKPKKVKPEGRLVARH